MKLNLKTPLFPILLVIFFFLHALLENYNPVLIKTALWLILVNLFFAALLLFLFRLLLKDWRKAAFPVFLLMAFQFFFGSIYDFLFKYFPESIVAKSSFQCALVLLIIIATCIFLKKTKRKLQGLTLYLNILFLIFILYDAVSVCILLIKGRQSHVIQLSSVLSVCDSCNRPDIYFIIADEYASNQELKNLLSFDNSLFENELKAKGFHVVANSKSNYNATVYSMASMLNMDYINRLNIPSWVNHKDMLVGRELIKNNNLINFLKKNGYSFYNYSHFDFIDKNKAVRNHYFIPHRLLFTGQTLIRRFIRNAGARFVSKEKLVSIKRKNSYNDIKIDSLTRKTVTMKDLTPKFVYTHFTMPHHPYYFDSVSNETPVEKFTTEFRMNKKAYTGYLQYVNKKLLSLIDYIQSNSPRPPIIILMGDHGFRQLPEETDHQFHFMNLNAVYLPDKNYNGFYDGMTNVNQFRVIVNTVFHQKIPLLKDSTSFLIE